MIKQSYEFLKNNIIILLFIDLIYFISTIFVALYLFKLISNKIIVLMASGAQLQQLSETVQETTGEITTQILSLESLTSTITNLLFLLPFALFILYILLQGVSWKTIVTKKFSIDKIYLFKFTLMTLTYSVIVYLFWKLLITKIILGNLIFIALILILFTIYLTMISYVIIPKYKSVAELFKKSFILGIKNIKTSFSVFVIFFFIFIFLYIILKSYPIILALILIILYIYFKILFVNSVKYT